MLQTWELIFLIDICHWYVFLCYIFWVLDPGLHPVHYALKFPGFHHVIIQEWLTRRFYEVHHPVHDILMILSLF
jgi:hypothetical protein